MFSVFFMIYNVSQPRLAGPNTCKIFSYILLFTEPEHTSGMNLKAPRVALVPSRPRGTKTHDTYRIHAHAQNQGESLY